MPLYPIQRSFNAGELTPKLLARGDLTKYFAGASTMLNWVVEPQGGATRRPGLEYIAAAGYSGSAVRLIPFVFNVTQAYILELGVNATGHGYIRFYMDGGQIQSGGSAYELVDGGGGVTIPWTAAQLMEIKYTQSADVLSLYHPAWMTLEITRTGHTAWTITSMSIGASASAPTTVAAVLTGTGTGTDHSYKVTTVLADTFEEGLPCAAVTTDGPATLDTTNFMTLTWDAMTGANHYYVYKAKAGTYGYLGRADSETFVDDGSIIANVNDTPPQNKNPFSGAGLYPAAGVFHQQRLAAGGATLAPQEVDLSQTANFHNFNRSFPLRDDDACTFVLASNQVNVIRWMVSAKSLIIGTTGSEWSLNGGNYGSPITPSSVQANQESQYGSENVQPVTAGNVILFVQRGGRRLREMVYSYDADGYISADLLVMADHLTEGYGIIDMAFQQSPNQVVWCVRSDGVLLGMTYMREHEVVAWHRHTTGADGLFESVAVIPGDNGEDELWVVVKRTINGSDVRYIERLATTFISNSLEDAFFVDSGLSYSGAAVTSVSGLDHLEGETVSVLADGSPQANRVVSGGSITLDSSSSVVHVGLPYNSDLMPMPMEVGEANKSMRGTPARITKAILQIHRSMVVKVGSSFDSLDEIWFRDSYDLVGEPLDPFSGLVEKEIDSEPSRTQQVAIRQDKPLPLTVTGLIVEIEA
jgi:hypothetical protein